MTVLANYVQLYIRLTICDAFDKKLCFYLCVTKYCLYIIVCTLEIQITPHNIIWKSKLHLSRYLYNTNKSLCSKSHFSGYLYKRNPKYLFEVFQSHFPILLRPIDNNLNEQIHLQNILNFDCLYKHWHKGNYNKESSITFFAKIFLQNILIKYLCAKIFSSIAWF